ncbi:MAG: oxidoreductase [Opitutae bacterium]|nr:oxidoreductase [Opitutae bacterium]|tara:strand:- start:3624 stop:4556 length:933 start_codon:yes stop_codon:yes gene_type:complete
MMFDTRKIKCGVAGVGYLGRHHARIYDSLGSSELVGIFEPNDDAAHLVCSSHKCLRFSSLEELGAACDAVSVVSPTDRHAEVAIPLIHAGCHLLVEKPLCVSSEEAELILNEAQSSGTIVQVGHIEHYNPVMKFLEKAVNKPKYLTGERLAPFQPRGTEVGVVLDLMIHDIGIAMALVDSPIKQVDAIGVRVLSSAEDIANARLVFENQCVANLSASRVSEKKAREIRVFQDAGYLSLDFMNQKGHLIEKNGISLEKKEVPVEKGEPLALELDYFLRCVSEVSTPKTDGNFGKSALEVALSITRQIEEAW